MKEDAPPNANGFEDDEIHTASFVDFLNYVESDGPSRAPPPPPPPPRPDDDDASSSAPSLPLGSFDPKVSVLTDSSYDPMASLEELAPAPAADPGRRTSILKGRSPSEKASDGATGDGTRGRASVVFRPQVSVMGRDSESLDGGGGEGGAGDEAGDGGNGLRGSALTLTEEEAGELFSDDDGGEEEVAKEEERAGGGGGPPSSRRLSDGDAHAPRSRRVVERGVSSMDLKKSNKFERYNDITTR